jgi:transposase
MKRRSDLMTPMKNVGTTQGYLWVISRPGAGVVFDWPLSRCHGELTSLIDGFQGVLESDLYEAYPSYVRSHAGVAWVGCWAHARRYFVEAMSEKPRAVQLVLRLIARLYRLESEWDEAAVGDNRAELRQRHFARPIRWLRRIATGLGSQALRRSLLGKACAYLLEHSDVLVTHQQYSVTRLDTNLLENAIRPSAIGKKNWLFIATARTHSPISATSCAACPR